MSSSGRRVLAVLAVAASLAGCSANRDEGGLFDPSAVGMLVVDAVLVVDQPLPPIFLRKILAPDAAYSAEAAAVHGAQMTIAISETDTVVYEEQDLGSTSVGRYLPRARSLLVEPSTEYTLRVLTNDGRRVFASTVTPERFAVSGWVLMDEQTLVVRRGLHTFRDAGDSVYTAPENQLIYQDGLLEARFAPGPSAGRYHIGLQSLDLGSDFVIEGDFLDEEDFENFQRQSSSPALEASGDFVRLPWFAIFFAGRYKIKVFAVDENWFDLARSSPALIGIEGPSFGGNAGDNFDRPIFHIEGAIGLFGSGAVDSIGFTILPRE